MSRKLISIQKDVYDKLLKEKKKQEKELKVKPFSWTMFFREVLKREKLL